MPVYRATYSAARGHGDGRTLALAGDAATDVRAWRPLGYGGVTAGVACSTAAAYRPDSKLCRDREGIDLRSLGRTPQNGEMMAGAELVGANYIVKHPRRGAAQPLSARALPQFTFGFVHDQFDAALQRKMNARLKLAGKLRELVVLGCTKVWSSGSAVSTSAARWCTS